jgi:RNA polymerase-binding protein DksA
MERMQTVLHEERERLADRLEDVGNFLNDKGWGGRAEIATTDDDTVDMASQAVERERELALRSNLEDLLERVEKALAKIDEGEYGVCERCGEKISRERLKAVPHATMCVRCRAIIDG